MPCTTTGRAGVLPFLLLTIFRWDGASAAPFIGQFELKTLASEPGAIELQSQNAWAWDQPHRGVVSDDEGELLFEENSAFRERYALEIEVGLAPRLKMRVGIEGENEWVDDPTSVAGANAFAGLDVEEIGAEVIAVLRARDGDGVGFGLVAEIEGPFEQEEPNHLTLGTIVEYQVESWFFAAVPMVVHAFGGDTEAGKARDEKWDLAYALQVQREVSERWSIGLEGYGTIERIGSSGHPSMAAQVFGDAEQHRLGPVTYISHEWGSREDSKELTIGLGWFKGLTSDTADHTAKLSIEFDY